MKRKIANKIASVFVPTLMIVLITFTTFWLGPSSIADRVTIGITAFLAIVTQFSQSRSDLPPVSYLSVRVIHVWPLIPLQSSVSLCLNVYSRNTFLQGVDVWNMVCMIFVSFQLLQATLVHFLNERNTSTAGQESDAAGEVEEGNERGSSGSRMRWTGMSSGGRSNISSTRTSNNSNITGKERTASRNNVVMSGRIKLALTYTFLSSRNETSPKSERTLHLILCTFFLSFSLFFFLSVWKGAHWQTSPRQQNGLAGIRILRRSEWAELWTRVRFPAARLLWSLCHDVRSGCGSRIDPLLASSSRCILTRPGPDHLSTLLCCLLVPSLADILTLYPSFMSPVQRTESDSIERFYEHFVISKRSRGYTVIQFAHQVIVKKEHNCCS